MSQQIIPPDLLSLLYATASDRTQWQAFCDGLNRVADVPIMIFGHNLGTNESLGIIAGGLDPAELTRYHQHYADKNPWMHMNAIMPVGEIGISDQALSREDLYKTEFYNDWLRNQEDIIGGPFMMCHRTNETFVGMAAACRARGVDETLPHNFGLFEALAPHMAKAISLSSVLVNGGPVSFEHLETSRHAIILLARSGRVAFANPLAEGFMAQAQVIKVNSQERLIAKDEAVRGVIAAAHKAMANNAFTKLPGPIRIETNTFGECILHCHIFPSDIDHEFPASAWIDPIIGAFVISGERGLDQQDNFGQLAQSMGATPAEALLAEAIMGGQSLYDYADGNALSRHTVRNQMRALLHKTSSRNQIEFVHKMHKFSSPFTSPQK